MMIRKTALKELARQCELRHVLPCDDPQVDNLWFAGHALNVSSPSLKLSLWGPPHRITLSINKPDVWDRRMIREPVVTLKEIREGAFCEAFASEDESQPFLEGYPSPSGVRAEGYRGWFAYDSPVPKPVGQLIFLCEDFVGCPNAEAVRSLSDGSIRVSVCNPASGAKLDVKLLTLQDEPLIVVQGFGENLRNPVYIRLYRHNDVRNPLIDIAREGFPYEDHPEMLAPIAHPVSYQRSSCVGILQTFPAEKTFPEGFSYAFAASCPDAVSVSLQNETHGLGTPATTIGGYGNREYLIPSVMPDYHAVNRAAGSAATMETNGNFLAYVTVSTTNDARDVVSHSADVLSSCQGRNFSWFREKNRKWYDGFYDRRERGRVFLFDEQFDREYVKMIFNSWCDYNSGCVKPDPFRFEADSVYTPFHFDAGYWHSLVCYNDIYDAPWKIVSAQEDRLEYWVEIVSFWLEAARKNAREVFGMDGAYISHGYLPPVKADCYAHCHSTLEFCMEIGAQLFKVLWDIWEYVRDDDFLKKKTYPYLRELAVFYSEYVTQKADGTYEVVPTVSAEHWGFRYRFSKNRNTASAISLIRYTLRNAAKAARYLNRDLDKVDRWEQIADHMTPLPTAETPFGVLATDAEGVNPLNVNYNHFAGWIPVLLTDEITIDSSREEKERMLRSVDHINGWHRAEVPYLLGERIDEILEEACWFHRLQPGGSLSGMVEQRDYAGLCRVFDHEIERLVNSRSGIIHIFPAFQANCRIAFHELRAKGGFLVSASAHGEPDGTFAVEEVRIRSTRGGICRICLPWSGEVASLETEAGQEYLLNPSGGSGKTQEV